MKAFDRLSAPDQRRVLALVEIEREAQRRGLGDDDPVAWVARRLREHLWSKQAEIARSVRDHRRTAVHSCHSAGKSFIAARLAAWWLETHEAGTAFVVTTAPTYRQVRAVLWREIARAHAKGKLRGHVNQTEWWIDSELVAVGYKPADHDQAAFQGIHAWYVLVIIDEAAGVPKELWDAASSLISNEDSRLLAIGNPDDPGSYFAGVCQPGSGWNVIGIDALESPNFTGEEVPDALRPLLVSPTWERERAAEWGEESPLYVARVRGQFPDAVTDALIPLSWVRRCQADPLGPTLERAWSRTTPIELGVDVGAGGDRTVIYARAGARATLQWRGQTPDPMEVVGRVVAAINETGAGSVKVDAIGIGWGVCGRLEELREQGVHRAVINGINVGAAPRDPTKFGKLRDEIWWEVGRELSRTQGWDLRDVDDVTVGQLIAPKYAPDSAGRVKVERKEDTKARLGRSPDDADALLLAFYDPGPLTDPAYVYGIWTCVACGHLFVWLPGRPCRQCGRPAPIDDPFAAGPGRWAPPDIGTAEPSG
jgi:hypothetical protein